MTTMDGLIELVFQFRSTQYTTAAAITLWAYDYLLTFPEEIHLVWQKPGVWTKILFSISRNLPIVYTYFITQLLLPVPTGVSSKQDCQVGATMIVACNVLQIFVLHTIFTIRIYKMSHEYPQFQIFVVTLLIIASTVNTVFGVINIKEVFPSLIFSPQAKACLYLTPTRNFYPVMMTIASLVLETIIFAGTIHHTIRFQRKVSALEGARSVGILRRLLLHGGQFYALVMLSRFGILLSFYIAPLAFQLLLPNFNYFITSVIISRFVLSLQRKIVDSSKPQVSRIGTTIPSIMITQLPTTFLYSGGYFGRSSVDHSTFEPETFISMESLSPFSRNKDSDTLSNAPGSK